MTRSPSRKSNRKPGLSKILASPDEVKSVEPKLKTMGLGRLPELAMKIKKKTREEETAVRTKIQNGWKQTESDFVNAFKWHNRGVTVKPPQKNARESWRKYFANKDPHKNDGWNLEDCENRELQLIFKFLLPFLTPDRGLKKRISIKVAHLVIKRWKNELEVNWGKILYEQFERMRVAFVGGKLSYMIPWLLSICCALDNVEYEKPLSHRSTDEVTPFVNPLQDATHGTIDVAANVPMNTESCACYVSSDDLTPDILTNQLEVRRIVETLRLRLNQELEGLGPQVNIGPLEAAQDTAERSLRVSPSPTISPHDVGLGSLRLRLKLEAFRVGQNLRPLIRAQGATEPNPKVASHYVGQVPLGAAQGAEPQDTTHNDTHGTTHGAANVPSIITDRTCDMTAMTCSSEDLIPDVPTNPIPDAESNILETAQVAAELSPIVPPHDVGPALEAGRLTVLAVEEYRRLPKSLQLLENFVRIYDRLHLESLFKLYPRIDEID